MPDGTQYDLSSAVKDPDFIRASVPDKIAFLSAHDSDFASAPLGDKIGYLNHILGQNDSSVKASTYERLTSSYNPNIENFAEKHPIAGIPLRFLDAVGGGLISAPEATYKLLRDYQNPVSETGQNIGESLHELATNPNVIKSAPSLLPEALGQGIGGTAFGEITGAAAGAIIPRATQLLFPRNFLANKIIDEMGNPTPGARLALGQERSKALGELLKPEIADSQKAQMISAARDEMYNDLASRAMTRGVEQEKLDNMFSDRLKAIEDARQKELADWERLRNQNAQSLVRRGKEQSAIDKANAPVPELGSPENPGWVAKLPDRMPAKSPELGSPENPGWVVKLPDRMPAKSIEIPIKTSPFEGMTSTDKSVGNAQLPQVSSAAKELFEASKAKFVSKFDTPKEAAIAEDAYDAASQDLISRTRRLVKPGEEPTAADLKRAGDLTQAPLSRLKALAKFGDKLAQNEINRRLKNP